MSTGATMRHVVATATPFRRQLSGGLGHVRETCLHAKTVTWALQRRRWVPYRLQPIRVHALLSEVAHVGAAVLGLWPVPACDTSSPEVGHAHIQVRPHHRLTATNPRRPRIRSLG